MAAMTHPNPALRLPSARHQAELVDRWIVADVLGEHRSEERQRSCGPTIGIATRYDKYALTYLGGVILAAAITVHRLQSTDTT